MNWILRSLLIGMGLGLLVVPLFLFIFQGIKNTRERRKIKRMIKQGRMLIPIDPNDFDSKAWQNQKYGNIKLDTKELDEFNKKIFRKTLKDQDENFFIRIKDYIGQARKIGYTDEQIKEEFVKKSYSDDLIDKIFEENARQKTN